MRGFLYEEMLDCYSCGGVFGAAFSVLVRLQQKRGENELRNRVRTRGERSYGQGKDNVFKRDG